MVNSSIKRCLTLSRPSLLGGGALQFDDLARQRDFEALAAQPQQHPRHPLDVGQRAIGVALGDRIGVVDVVRHQLVGRIVDAYDLFEEKS